MRFSPMAVLLLVLFSQIASAATVHGNAYDADTLDVVGKAIITVNTAPEQVSVAENGSYSLEVPDGAYSITAKKFENGTLVLEARDSVTVSGNGSFTLDLLMLPPGRIPAGEDADSLDILGEVNLSDYEFNQSDLYVQEPPKPAESVPAIAQGAIAVLLLAGIAYYAWTKAMGKKNDAAPAPGAQMRGVDAKEGKEGGRAAGAGAKSAEPETIILTPEQKQAVSAMKKAGGFLAQKELRKAMPFSEAKVSLIVTELEEMGAVKKFKRGRGNIIKLVKR
ncbi:Uncharacterised protein [uncultured archaeon]|nr:Uncharacterised protein [uncultured archaeon]